MGLWVLSAMVILTFGTLGMLWLCKDTDAFVPVVIIMSVMYTFLCAFLIMIMVASHIDESRLPAPTVTQRSIMI